MVNNLSAVIPVREGSRRLPDKNISKFGGSNLLVWKIRQLKEVKEVANIYVSSDSDTMLKLAEIEGVKTHKRSAEYCDEKTKSFGEVVEHICSNIKGEHVLWATCTSPLVLPKNYSKAINKYHQALKEGFDSLMSVEPFKRYIWDEKGPLNYKLGKQHVPSQELDQLYFITDGILLAPRKKMIEWSYFHGTHPYKYELDKIHCVDIDDKLDLEMAKAWLPLISTQ